MSGASARVSGHFGEWLQGRVGPSGPVALITLPCPALGARVQRRDGALEVSGGARVLDTVRLAAFLERLGARQEGTWEIALDAPPGAGTGMSSASLTAVAQVTGVSDGNAVLRACLAVEGATDPVMLKRPDTHLWASREGRSLLRLEAPPAAEIVGGYWGPPLRTDAGDGAFPDIADLLAPWVEAVAAGDLAGVADIASTSARRTTAMRGPEGDPTERLAREVGAIGHVRAHTGSVRGLVFAPGTVPEEVGKVLSRAGYDGVMRFSTGGSA